MKELNGISHNLSGEVLGIVTKRNRNIFSRRNYILVSDDFNDVKSRYVTMITTRSLETQNPYLKVDSLDSFEDGDVISITPEGRVVFLY